MPNHEPPQYVCSDISHLAVVDPSVRANRSVMTWYIVWDRHSAALSAETAPWCRAAAAARIDHVVGAFIVSAGLRVCRERERERVTDIRGKKEKRLNRKRK